MPSRLLSGICVAALVIAGCGSMTADTVTSSQPAATSVAAPTSTSVATPITTTPTTVPVDVIPALGVSASDTFDDAGLFTGQTGFVPLDDPVMVAASDVTWLGLDDVVMGVAHSSGEAHAYPVSQMAYHHIANTTIGGEPFLVTY